MPLCVTSPLETTWVGVVMLVSHRQLGRVDILEAGGLLGLIRLVEAPNANVTPDIIANACGAIWAMIEFPEAMDACRTLGGFDALSAIASRFVNEMAGSKTSEAAAHITFVAISALRVASELAENLPRLVGCNAHFAALQCLGLPLPSEAPAVTAKLRSANIVAGWGSVRPEVADSRQGLVECCRS